MRSRHDCTLCRLPDYFSHCFARVLLKYTLRLIQFNLIYLSLQYSTTGLLYPRRLFATSKTDAACGVRSLCSTSSGIGTWKLVVQRSVRFRAIG